MGSSLMWRVVEVRISAEQVALSQHQGRECALAGEVETACNKLEEEGYTPIGFKIEMADNRAMIVFKRKQDQQRNQPPVVPEN